MNVKAYGAYSYLYILSGWKGK